MDFDKSFNPFLESCEFFSDVRQFLIYVLWIKWADKYLLRCKISEHSINIMQKLNQNKHEVVYNSHSTDSQNQCSKPMFQNGRRNQCNTQISGRTIFMSCVTSNKKISYNRKRFRFSSPNFSHIILELIHESSGKYQQTLNTIVLNRKWIEIWAVHLLKIHPDSVSICNWRIK